MSRTVQFPVSVEFAIMRRRWRVYNATLAGFARDLRVNDAPSNIGLPVIHPTTNIFANDPQIAFRIHAPVSHSSLSLQEPEPAYLILSGESRHLLQERFAPNDQLRQDDAAWEPFQILASFDDSPTQGRSGDPWQMREEFLDVSGGEALAKFLSKWGDWDSGLLFDLSRPPKLPAKLGDGLGGFSPSFVLPELVFKKQAFFRKALTQKPGKWLAGFARLPGPSRITSAPYFRLSDSFCVSAIETTITLDHLANVEYRICARDDCARPFQVRSAHGQTYCSTGCAHTVNMRKKRQSERKQKTSGKGA